MGFLMAGPKGAYGGLNDPKFLEWLEQVQAFNTRSGMRSMNPVRATDERALGPHFRLVTVEWEAHFAATGERGIRFEISYILHLTEAGPRIVAYVSHEDQEERMRQEGLL